MKCNFYTENDYKKHLLAQITKVECRHDMKIDAVENGTFVVDVKSGAFGLFDENGEFVKSSLQYRGKNSNFVPKYQSVTEIVDCDAVFLGNAYHHFGHFIIEHLNRAWGIRQCPNKQIKYVFIDNKNIGAKSWLFDFMKMMGIAQDDVLVLNKTMKFRRVFVPSQSFNNSGMWWANEFLIPFDVMRDNVSAGEYGDKIYVSRARLQGEMKTYNEEQVQKIFEKNGFKIIYPETMPLSEQVATVGNAHVLAGCAGTALHLAIFMKPGGRVIQLNRTQSIKDSGVLQYRMCQMRDLDFDIIAASVEEFKSQHGGSHAPQIIGVNANLKSFFDDNGFLYGKADLEIDKDALAQYRKQVEIFKSQHGSAIMQKVKKVFIKIISCFVPGRIRRGHVRKWLKEHL